MRLIDRLLFLLLALCFTAFGILMIYSVLNAQVVLSIIENLLLNDQWIVVIAGAVVAFVGIFLVLNMLFTRKEKIAKVLGNDMGQVTMSIEAIESMINRTVSGISGIKEVTPKLKIVGDKVAVCLHLTVQSDMIVPELGSTIQKAVKENLESMAGISIAEIKILVSSVDGASGGKTSKSNPISLLKKSEKAGKAEKEQVIKDEQDEIVLASNAAEENAIETAEQPQEEEKAAVSE